MLLKIKNTIVRYIKSLGDIKVLGQTIFVILVLLTSWSGIKAIQANYEIQKDIALLEKEINIKELENKNQELANKYLETEDYLEIAVRQYFGKAATGERVYIVPTDVALKYAPSIESSEEDQEASEKRFYNKNLESWRGFFFKRSNQFD